MSRVIILDRDAVHEQLARIAAVAGRTAAAPIQGHALIQATKDGIHVTATDMDIWLSVSLPADCERFSGLCLPAKDLHDVIAALPAGSQAEIKWAKEDATSVSIKSGRTRFTLPIMAASDFPPEPAGETEAQFTASSAILNAMLARTKWAVGKEETRYYLNGVFLHAEGERLVCAATNGHLLARADGAKPDGAEDLGELKGESAFTGGVIIPTAAVKLIGALIGDNDADVDLAVSATHLRLDREDEKTKSKWSLTCRLIDGTFPDYTRVIPNGDDLVEGDVEASVLSAALARVALLAPETNAIKLEGAKGLLRISTMGIDGRAAEEEIDAAWADKPPAKAIGFNARYLKTMLDGIAAETVILRLSDGEGASILAPRGRDDTLAVIMPVRVA